MGIVLVLVIIINTNTSSNSNTNSKTSTSTMNTSSRNDESQSRVDLLRCIKVAGFRGEGGVAGPPLTPRPYLKLIPVSPKHA